MSRITELREKQAKAVAEARECLDQIDGADEARAKELEASHDKAMSEYDRLEKLIEREEKLAERERAMEEPDVTPPQGEDRSVGGGAGGDSGQAAREKRKLEVYLHYVRHGMEDMDAEMRKILRTEMRAQATTTDSAGGYLVPVTLVTEVILSMKAWGPMLDPGVTRQLNTTGGGTINWPTLNDTANQAYRLNENTQVTGADGDLAFGTKPLDAYKYASGAILVPSELFQDSAINVDQIINAAMGERFGRKVNADLTTGDGVGDPNGIVTASSEGFEASLPAGIGFDDMIELEHSVDPAYRLDPSVGWMFHDNTLKALRKIKDTEGNYIWQPAGVRDGAPATLLNYRYAINQAMPTVAASAKSVLFGAMNRYIVRRVQEIAIRRLVERYADYDQTGFLGFARFDGDLMDVAAVKHLVHPAA
ncbi:MAG: phage major capsid protein [Oceanibaculum nanhaiense]|jgi:HK97 family phage major capsid protein|uniref:phage major capsid protein n=1 Tax=Oceanibaculum nanhaiense TaxID=1909734 RepID=UPI0032EBD605